MANIRLVTPKGRTSFMKVYKAEDNMNATKKVFTLKLLFPKDTNMELRFDTLEELRQFVADISGPEVEATPSTEEKAAASG